MGQKKRKHRRQRDDRTLHPAISASTIIAFIVSVIILGNLSFAYEIPFWIYLIILVAYAQVYKYVMKGLKAWLGSDPARYSSTAPNAPKQEELDIKEERSEQQVIGLHLRGSGGGSLATPKAIAGEADSTLYEKIEMLQELGKHEAAREMIQDALVSYPEDPLLHQMLATTCLQEGEFDDARRILENALMIDPDDSSTHVEYALALIKLSEKQGDYKKKALKHARELVRREFGDPAILSLLAYIYKHIDRKRIARLFLLASIRGDCSIPYSRWEFANVAYGRLDHELALLLAQYSLYEEPDSAMSYQAYATSLVNMRKYKEAVAAGREATRLDPEAPESHECYQLAVACQNRLFRWFCHRPMRLFHKYFDFGYSLPDQMSDTLTYLITGLWILSAFLGISAGSLKWGLIGTLWPLGLLAVIFVLVISLYLIEYFLQMIAYLLGRKKAVLLDVDTTVPDIEIVQQRLYHAVERQLTSRHYVITTIPLYRYAYYTIWYLLAFLILPSLATLFSPVVLIVNLIAFWRWRHQCRRTRMKLTPEGPVKESGDLLFYWSDVTSFDKDEDNLYLYDELDKELLVVPKRADFYKDIEFISEYYMPHLPFIWND